MKRLLLAIGLAVMSFACTPKSGNINIGAELVDGQCIEMEWGKCSFSEKEENTYLYLNVSEWPKGEMLSVPGIKTKVKNIYLKSNPKQHFAWRFEKGELQVHIPSVLDKIDAVIVVKTKGKVRVVQS